MRQLFVVLLSAVVTACFGLGPSIRRPEYPSRVTSLTLIGQYSIPPLTRFPPQLGLLFGGISGLATRAAGTDLLGLTDANDGGRIYRFQIQGAAPGEAFRVTPVDFIALGFIPGGFRQDADQESLVVLPSGNILVSTEGSDKEPRLGPSIVMYGPHGEYLRELPVPDQFVPEPTGPVTKGAHGSTGFESLTLAPNGRHLFTGSESSLIQDDEPANFEHGTRTRLLEYSVRKESFEPRRQFVYQLERLDKPSFEPSFFINGLVDLLALDSTTMLALERGYAENGDKLSHNAQIRVFKISIAGATDISKIAALKNRTDVTPVTKTLLLDLANAQGLSPDLRASGLDNFEGMAFGPRLPDGRASLIMVSDDNFSLAQRTWFLLFAIE